MPAAAGDTDVGRANGLMETVRSLGFTAGPLLGGAHRLWGPALGAIPLTLLFEFLAARFPTVSTLIMGVVFLLIVYALPSGVVGLWDNFMRRGQALRAAAQGAKA